MKMKIKTERRHSLCCMCREENQWLGDVHMMVLTDFFLDWNMLREF